MFGQRWRLMSPWLTDSFSWETVDGKRKETGFLCPLGFPGGSVSKESACKAGDLGWIPGLGRSPWRRKWQPTPVFLPGKSPWTEELGGLQSRGSQSQAWLTTAHTSFALRSAATQALSEEYACNAGDLGWIPGLGTSTVGGHVNPLQYSCLENPHEQRSLDIFSKIEFSKFSKNIILNISLLACKVSEIVW